jgi:energy-coupling factor transport system permease protein
MGATSLTLGRFVHRRSPLHSLDAATKLLCTALVVTATVWSTSLGAQLGIAFLCALAFGVARLPAGVLLRALRGALWLLLFVAAANVVWAFISRHAGWAGDAGAVRHVGELALLLVRLLNLILLGVLFTATTVPVDVAEGIERLLRPLARLRLPVHQLGVLLVLSLSFIPIFFDEARHLVAAHRVKMGSARWGWRHRARAVVPLMVPLFLSVLRRGDELAVALDARCFVPGRPRSSLVSGRLGLRELAVLALGAAVLIASVWWL